MLIREGISLERIAAERLELGVCMILACFKNAMRIFITSLEFFFFCSIITKRQHLQSNYAESIVKRILCVFESQVKHRNRMETFCSEDKLQSNYFHGCKGALNE